MDLIVVCRCAVHFSSPRTEGNNFSIYQLFRGVRVYEADDISSQLVLSQDGKPIYANLSKSRLHIEEAGTQLRIYVPKDPKEQELCYLGLLPQRLLDFMMTDPITNLASTVSSNAVTIIGNVLKSSSFVVDDFLEEAGIIPVNIPDDYQPADSEAAAMNPTRRDSYSPVYIEDSDNEQASSTCTNTPSSGASESNTRSHFSPSHTISSHTVEVTSSFASAAPFSRSNIIPPTAALQQSLLHSDSPNQPASPHMEFESNNQYERLLDKIITASKTAIFPTRGSFNMDALRSALPETQPSENLESTDLSGAFGLRSQNQINHDIKIGAAGELFVSNLLYKLIRNKVRSLTLNYRSLKFFLD
jgi:hypothetical protein